MSDCVDQMSDIKYNAITEMCILTDCCVLRESIWGVHAWGFGLAQIQESPSEKMTLLL